MPPAGKAGARRPTQASKKPAKGTTKVTKVTKATKQATKATKKTAARAKSTAARGSARAKATASTSRTRATATKPAATSTAKKPSKTAAKTTKASGKAAPAKAAPAKRGGKRTVICELSGFEVTPSAPNLSPKTLERLRKRLLEERERLRRQSEELAAEAEQLAREREGGDTQFDEESGEGDTVNVERERDLLLSASARQDVEDIDEALVRLKRGTYGVCKYAGRRLPLERLELLPWADVCVDCKARAERRR
jgi:RNA polymerase-binding transcription factor DksA